MNINELDRRDVANMLKAIIPFVPNAEEENKQAFSTMISAWEREPRLIEALKEAVGVLTSVSTSSPNSTIKKCLDILDEVDSL